MATNARQVFSRALDKGMPRLSRLENGYGADIPHKNSIAPKPSSRKALAQKEAKAL